ncbi:hypothetical protein ACLFMI_22645 [Pseudonocardia nantongensis]|uniref:hypothetical protein n=1 Tax=Pseudonocardia nantongensis TaxID=1181885 RepID=UPI00397B61E0
MTAELIEHQPIPDAAPTSDAPAGDVAVPARSTVHRLLDSIDDLVRRHRALAGQDGAAETLHAELIAAELDQQVAVLRRLPRQSRS